MLVVAVHPDDETLGAGGTLFRHKANGDSVAWLIVTSMHERQGFSPERIRERDAEISSVSKAFGMEHVFRLDFPTSELSSSSLLQLVPAISKIFHEYQPSVIYLPNRSDAHSDHRITFDAVMACTKSFRYPSIREVLMYECLSETEFGAPLPENSFIPNYYVDISEFLTKKNEVLKLFRSEMGEHPFPRSARNVEALATFRGATAGVEYAEAFSVVKIIHK
ncbi:MAG TPA: PIG-L family deacetylase [Bacteroidia bacterium]|nr:PIG-L family deacetylase [Bacteroidia bacterium]